MGGQREGLLKKKKKGVKERDSLETLRGNDISGEKNRRKNKSKNQTATHTRNIASRIGRRSIKQMLGLWKQSREEQLNRIE